MRNGCSVKEEPGGGKGKLQSAGVQSRVSGVAELRVVCLPGFLKWGVLSIDAQEEMVLLYEYKGMESKTFRNQVPQWLPCCRDLQSQFDFGLESP